MKNAITILKSEHRSLSAVLQALKELARMAQDPKLQPDWRPLRAMLRYIDEYPERLHHPKEDKFLFARLAQRSADARRLVEDLKSEHVQGARLIRELERAFLFFEERWPQGGREFLAAVDDYAEFEWAHMRKEERDLLPLAERHLKPEDWEAIDNAFAGNTDPLESVKERDFDSLLARIANLAPAPVGLGSPWKKAN
jgi:branched-chain amino acid transport system ATP-binding protein